MVCEFFHNPAISLKSWHETETETQAETQTRKQQNIFCQLIPNPVVMSKGLKAHLQGNHDNLEMDS